MSAVHLPARAEIRAERRGEATAIHGLTAAAFGREAEARLVDLLRAGADPFVSLVAEEAGRIVGQVTLSPMVIDAPAAPRCGALGPIAVDPSRQGDGIGGRLVRAALGRAREVGWRAVFLLGSPAYYGRFGFGPASERGFDYDRMPGVAAFQVIELDQGALDGCRGQVRYHRAFDAV